MAEIHQLRAADPALDTLWTIRELAAYMRYAETTLAKMVSTEPEKLPPRIALLGRPRWDPVTVRQWAAQQSGLKRKPGRPRINRAS